jgi:uncharacterized repeat protein (TIGR03803 family)
LRQKGTLNQATDGKIPDSGVWRGSDGNFYGVTEAGGTNTDCASNLGGCGVIFKITPAGSYSVLFDFEDPDGYEPGSILQHTNGNLYGNTAFGGTIDGSPSSGGTFYRFSDKLAPFIALLPYTGKVGSTIEFPGQGFTSTSTVSFNGTVTKPTSVSGTYLTAKVPAGATTGIVSVTTSGGTLKSLYKFRVMPQITSFSPPSGVVGTTVKITGVSLTQTTAVTFGGVKANSFRVNSDTPSNRDRACCGEDGQHRRDDGWGHSHERHEFQRKTRDYGLQSNQRSRGNNRDHQWQRVHWRHESGIQRCLGIVHGCRQRGSDGDGSYERDHRRDHGDDRGRHSN